MDDAQVVATSNRSVVGIMNEFILLAEAGRNASEDLTDIAMWLARTPCSPLYHRHTSPDRELAALIAQHAQR